MTTAEKIAKVHYQRNEWSGCSGSGWDNLPQPAQDRYIAQAQEWINSMGVAGFIVAIPA